MEAESSIKHSKILIVEDNKINQLLVKNVLKNFGFLNYDTAEDSEDAFRKLSANSYDIVLMDIQMPGMDGCDITIEIRTKMQTNNRHVPVIALTGNSSEVEKTKAKAAGMNDYVVKPYSPEELYSILVKHLSKNGKADVRDYEVNIHTGNGAEINKHDDKIELGCLEKYTGGDLSMTIQLIELFLKEVPESIDKLEILIPEEKWNEVHSVSHKMKSCFSVFELMELKKIVLAIEGSSHDLTDLKNIPGLFISFKEGCRHAVLNLEVELQKIKK